MSDTRTVPEPTLMAPAEDRLHLIDTLRAIALFGVITMNITGMVAALAADRIFPAATSLDLAFASFDLIVLQGKARSCFAFLFGVGFGILMARAASKGSNFVGFYLARMTALLAIGLLNLAFLFWGDILILYALLGMAMLAFRNASDRLVLSLGLLLILLPPVVFGAIEAATGAPMPNLAGLGPDAADEAMAALAPVYGSGTYAEFVQANFQLYFDGYRTDTAHAVTYDLGVLGLFLLGLWAARRGLFADVERWRPLFRKLAWLCLPLGLLLSLIHATRWMGIEADGAAYGLVTAAYAGLPIAAFGYIAVLTLWLSRGGTGVQRALAPMGRMALTGYLASNAIGAFIWYGWGLGQLGAWNFAAMNLLALILFAALCLFSAAWIRRFRFGPFEWLWRSATYGKLQPMRRSPVGLPRPV
jgi:uncharacterized protein